MADGGFRFPGAGQYYYQQQGQQAHHARHSHQRNASPVNNPRIGFHTNDTPSPNRSPGTHSPAHSAYSMFNQGHQHNQHGLLNGAQSHQRFQMQMNMNKHHPHQGSQYQPAHHQSQLHHDPGAHNGHAFGTHQHNISTGTLSSATPHFTPSHLQSTTPSAAHASVAKPANKHWELQISLAQASREATQPHHYARNGQGVSKQASGQPADAQSEEDQGEKHRPQSEKQIAKQAWQALDFSGQGLKTISPALFRYAFLEKIYFNHNRLSWLTPQIGQLRHLTFLDLSQNNLDSLPPEIGMLVNLKTLHLFDNNLHDLPSEMGSLYQLQMLGIEGNPLSSDLKSIVEEAGTGELIRYLREHSPGPEPPIDRDWVEVLETPTADEDRFTMLSYNILCDKMATQQQYGYAPTAALAWENRRELIMTELRTHSPDFICLQEVDLESYNEHFRPTLAYDDYKGFLFQRTRAQTMSDKDSKYVDGCAIFYKNSKYILLDKQVIEFSRISINRPDMKGQADVFNRLMPRDHIGVVAFFENRVTGSRLIVTNSHVFWDPVFVDVKLIQIAILLEQTAILAETYAKWPPCKDKELFKYAANGEDTNGDAVRKAPGPSLSYASASDIPMLVCGDFNSTAGSSVCELISTGSLDASHPDLAGRSYGKYTREGMGHPFKLKSSYASMGELSFTNYTPGFVEVIDYIFYSTNALQVTTLLGDVDKDYLQRVPGFPNYHFPSDHLPLLAEFVVKSKKEKRVVDADFGQQRSDRR